MNHQAATGLMAKTGRTYKVTDHFGVLKSGRFNLVFIWRADSGLGFAGSLSFHTKWGAFFCTCLHDFIVQTFRVSGIAA
jgi:hypothetical protein